MVNPEVQVKFPEKKQAHSRAQETSLAREIEDSFKGLNRIDF